MPKNNTLSDLADQVISRLAGKVTIHRYDSFSTDSIYLKFDYGVANSLRIGSHPGKQHLKYRFNLMAGQAGKPHYEIQRGGFPMHFYPPEEIDDLIDAILKAKDDKMAYYRSYDAVVNKARSEIDPGKGFWKAAREITAAKNPVPAPAANAGPDTYACSVCQEPTKHATGFWDKVNPNTGTLYGGQTFACDNIDCPHFLSIDSDTKIINGTINRKNGTNPEALIRLMRLKGVIIAEAAETAGATPTRLASWLYEKEPFDPDVYFDLMSKLFRMPDKPANEILRERSESTDAMENRPQDDTDA